MEIRKTFLKLEPLHSHAIMTRIIATRNVWWHNRFGTRVVHNTLVQLFTRSRRIPTSQMNLFASLSLRCLSAQTRGTRPRKLLIWGLVLSSLGTLLYVGLGEKMLDAILAWQVQLKEGNLITYIWRDLPFPLTLRVYVFEILNGNAFQEGLELPRVREIGPFYFNEYRKRKILDWPHDYGTVKFEETLSFEFIESKSVGPLSQQVTAINAPLLLILGFINSKVKQFYLSMFTPVVSNIIYIIFRVFEEKLVESRSVEEVLVGRKLGILGLVETLSNPLRSIGIEVPSISVGFYKLEEGTFGFINLRNNKTFGPAEVYTGQTNMGTFDSFYSLEEKKHLHFFEGTACQGLVGTEGTFFGVKPLLNKTLHLFNQHLCRPLKLIFNKQTISSSIYVNEYRIDPDMFSQQKRENWCFCPPELKRSECDGIFHMSQCLGGTPLVLSNVHFYNSPRQAKRVHGLNANYEQHTGFAHIDSVLGSTVNLSIRVQFNLDMKPIRVPSLNNFQQVVMPFIWIEEGAQLSGYLSYLLPLSSIIFHHLEHFYLFLVALGLASIALGLTRLGAKLVAPSPPSTQIKIVPDDAKPEHVHPVNYAPSRERIRLPPLDVAPKEQKLAPMAPTSASSSRKPNQVHPRRSAIYMQRTQP